MSADLTVPPLPVPQDSDDHDLKLAIDTVEKIKAAETNGGLLGAVLLYRFEIRKRYKADAEAALASLQARLEAADRPDVRALCELALKADFAFPALPPGIVLHKQLGDLFDRVAMQQYGLRVAEALLKSAMSAATQEKPAAPGGPPPAQCHQVSSGVRCAMPRPDGARQCPDCNPCWTITAPDGRQWLGKSPFKAASAAADATREPATPEQQAAFAALVQKHEADMLAEHEHLNCPACGGSGHIDDARGGWVAVADRMPEPDAGEVLVWLTGGRCAFDEWHMHREDPTGMGGPTLEMGYMWRDYDFEEVTHWRPLPAAPSEGSQG